VLDAGAGHPKRKGGMRTPESSGRALVRTRRASGKIAISLPSSAPSPRQAIPFKVNRPNRKRKAGDEYTNSAGHEVRLDSARHVSSWLPGE